MFVRMKVSNAWRRCHRVVATVLVREGVVGAAYVDDAGPGGDRERVEGGMFAAADRGPDWQIGFGGVSGGYAVTAGSAGISPCGSRCEHA